MNRVALGGSVSDIEYAYRYADEKFYKFKLSVQRRSGEVDVLPCIIHADELGQIQGKDKISVWGEIRTRIAFDGRGIRRKEVTVFVLEIREYTGVDMNKVMLDGVVCEKRTLRHTPLTNRKIVDMTIETTRDTGVTDYLPCITWENNAVSMEWSLVPIEIKGAGRLQSREYTKVYVDGTSEIRTAYEVSIMQIERRF